ncbi:TPA: hypothetical protein MYM51_004165 [Klebsiella pneumoniae]|nr:hypothetical protein [Klebsiella pneumoniae]
MMNKPERTKPDIVNGEGYAVNNSTLMAFIGVYLFPVLGIFMLIQAAFRLVACVWGFTMGEYDLPRTGLGVALAAICFIAAMLSYRGFDWCNKTLRRCRLPE